MKIALLTALLLSISAASGGAWAQAVPGAKPSSSERESQPNPSDPAKGNPFPPPPSPQSILGTAGASRFCVTPNDGWCDLVGAAVGSPCKCAGDNGKLYDGRAK